MEEKRIRKMIDEMVKNSPTENVRLFTEHEFIREELIKRGRQACNCSVLS